MENPEIKENPKFPEIAQDINIMAGVDQDMRQKEINEPGFWDDTVDKANTERMKVIITQIGWPTISKVGEDASKNAWLLVQHADHDVGFQKQCLDMMKQEPANEVNQSDVAYLEDRTRVNSGQLQLYGTQFNNIGGKYIPKEIEDPEYVEERRRTMGLSSLAENTELMYQKYKSEKPKE